MQSWTRQELEELRTEGFVTDEEWAEIGSLTLRVKIPGAIPYCPHLPHRQQRKFLQLTCREALYGGAAGGGKSDALLMAALQYVDVPSYSALLLRRTYKSLTMPGGLIPRLAEWLRGSAARWNGEERRWTFPSGATLTFGFVEQDRHLDRYQGPEFQFIGIDELTQHPEEWYRWFFSRLRRLAGVDIPLRVRGGTNPGGIGHEWVRRRFQPHLPESQRDTGDRVFVSARIDDNPSLDRGEYLLSLAELDPVERERLMNGDWSVRPAGGILDRAWFEIVQAEDLPAALRWIRAWDTAAKDKRQNDYWAGARCALLSPTPGFTPTLYVGHMVRGKWEYPPGRAEVIRTARADGPRVPIVIEDKSSGTALVQDLRRDATMAGHSVFSLNVRGDKRERAGPWASRAHGGLVKLVEGPWVEAFLDEAHAFGQEGMHDDQVDAVSTGYHALMRLGAALAGTVLGMGGRGDGETARRRGGARRLLEARAPRRV